MSEGRRAGNDPADDADRYNKADQRHPPLARAHWLRSRLEGSAAGDHRLGQMLAAPPIENDRRDMEGYQCKDDVEPQFVDVASLVRGVDADEATERSGVNSVLVLTDQAQSYLH